MLSKRENALLALHGEQTEYTPCFFDSCQVIPFLGIDVPSQMGVSGYDAYGVHQTATESAGGMWTPTPTIPPVLADVTEWKSVVKFPDFTKIPVEEISNQLKSFLQLDPANFVQDIFCANGIFERLHFLMGFENAVCSIYEEPEAVYDLVGAIADKKIEFMKLMDKYFEADYFTYLDDYAYEGGLMINPDIFRKIFKPHIARIVEACKDTKMTFKQHCCGKMEALVDDFLDIGVTAFDPVQCMNDIPAIKKKTLGRAGIMGGLDIQGVIDRSDVTPKEIHAEVKRCIDTYDEGGGYMIYGTTLSLYDPTAFTPGGKVFEIIQACEKYGKK